MRALVTGATSGIGLAIATEYAAAGYDLVLTGRRMALLRERAERLKHRYGCCIESYRVELSDRSERAQFIAQLKKYDFIHTVVNNAGYGLYAPVGESNTADLTAMIAVHCTTTVEITRALLPAMITNRTGAIINVSSVMGDIVVPSSALYCASKAFVTSFSETLALEVEEYGVRVVALLPGLTTTDFHARSHTWPFKGRASSLLWAHPQSVARYALAALTRRKVRVIPGVLNRLLGAAVRLVPRSLMYAVGRTVERKRRRALR